MGLKESSINLISLTTHPFFFFLSLPTAVVNFSALQILNSEKS